ncbi:hypothetical protein ACFE04_017249 [Oxalis oulophora]
MRPPRGKQSCLRFLLLIWMGGLGDGGGRGGFRGGLGDGGGRGGFRGGRGGGGRGEEAVVVVEVDSNKAKVVYQQHQAMAIGHLNYWLCKTCLCSTTFKDNEKYSPRLLKRQYNNLYQSLRFVATEIAFFFPSPFRRSILVVVIEETKMTTTTYYGTSTSSDWQDSAQTDS